MTRHDRKSCRLENERCLINRARSSQSAFHSAARPSNVFSVFRFRVAEYRSDRLPAEIRSGGEITAGAVEPIFQSATLQEFCYATLEQVRSVNFSKSEWHTFGLFPLYSLHNIYKLLFEISYKYPSFSRSSNPDPFLLRDILVDVREYLVNSKVYKSPGSELTS